MKSEYHVVYARDLADFIVEINIRLMDGWKTTGGVCAIEDRSTLFIRHIFYQGMVRDLPDPEPVTD